MPKGIAIRTEVVETTHVRARKTGEGAVNAPRPMPIAHLPRGKALWIKRAQRLMSLAQLECAPSLEPFREAAEVWREAASAELAMVAGGYAGPISLNAACAAAYQTAWSRWIWAQCAKEAHDPTDHSLVHRVEVASRLADASRISSFGAYELAIRIARASQGQPEPDPLEQVRVQGEHLDPGGTDGEGGGG